MYAGPLASVIFQKIFPNQKRGEQKQTNKKFTLCNKSPITTGKNIGNFTCCIMENMYRLIHFSPYLHTHAD